MITLNCYSSYLFQDTCVWSWRKDQELFSFLCLRFLLLDLSHIFFQGTFYTISYLFIYYILQIVPVTLADHYNMHLIFWVFSILLWIIFPWAKFSNPGIIKTNKNAYDEAVKMVSLLNILAFCCQLTSHLKSRTPLFLTIHQLSVLEMKFSNNPNVESYFIMCKIWVNPDWESFFVG